MQQKMEKRVVFCTVLLTALVEITNARLAPHFLSVGSGIGMPSVVRDKYHTTDSILHNIADLEKSCRYIVRHQVQAFDPATNGQRSNDAYTLTDPDTPKESKKRFMLTFGMHGREYISSETALFLSQYVCEKVSQPKAAVNTIATASTPTTANVQTTPKLSNNVGGALIPEALKAPKLENVPAAQEPALAATAASSSANIAASSQVNVELGAEATQADPMTRERLMTILKNTEIVFIPVVNVDGRKKVESGLSCTEQRKNGRNVDINRNFANWFNPNNAGPGEEDYQGPSPMSEWETNVIKTLADQFRPHAFIDIHSGDLGMGFIFGHSGVDRSPHDSVNKRWAQTVNNEAFAGQVWVGNLANMGSFPYQSHGSSCDYMYESQHARISGTWEIWRKSSFFATSSSTSSANAAAGAVVALSASAATNRAESDKQVASKYDYVSSNTFKVEDVSAPKNKQVEAIAQAPVALQTQAELQLPELSAMLQTSLGKDVIEGLGLSQDDIVTLVQQIKAQAHDTNQDIQVLLQDMSREQCFAYFNPVLPNHYDHTVSSFSRAILVGAENLSSSDIAAAIA